MGNIDRLSDKRDDRWKTPGQPRRRSAHDPDRAPDTYDPVVWRLCNKFRDKGLAYNHRIKQNNFIIYSKLSYYVEESDIIMDAEGENLVEEMIAWFWEEEWNIRGNPDFAVEEFLNAGTWREALRIIRRRRRSRELKEVYIDSSSAGEVPELELPDREINPPKPPRHPLGGPRVPDGSGFSDRVRSFVKEYREQEDESE